MGGSLTLESETGRGSTFIFTIPMQRSSEADYMAIKKEQELEGISMKGSFRVLVVEDNPSNQIVTEGLLEKILPESQTVLAEDGLKAISLLETEKFDLVLMDIRMPGIDGYETTRRLRLLNNENAKIPVIALTASVIRADIQRCQEAGMNDYVPKPISRSALAKALHNQLGISWDEKYVSKESVKANFLSGIKEMPAWADRLYDLCNGRKERFIKYLEIFLSQSESELGNWDERILQQRNEELAFSIHKLLPHVRLFLDAKMADQATSLDQELRNGWDENHSVKIISLKQAILGLQREVIAFLKVLG
jgi:CheY-like chemotaxis protein